jgi:hypothetical protein
MLLVRFLIARRVFAQYFGDWDWYRHATPVVIFDVYETTGTMPLSVTTYAPYHASETDSLSPRLPTPSSRAPL